jgi:PhnB protein
MALKTIPEGFHTVTPYLMVPGAADLLKFLEQVFDAEVTERMMRPDGAIMHAEIRVGDSMVMIGEVAAGHQPRPGAFYLFVEDVDAVDARALRAGATSLTEPQDRYYGNREAGVRDAFGIDWWLATRLEELSQAELAKRHEEAMAQRA